MKTKIYCFLITTLFAAISASNLIAATVEVRIENFSFNPPTVTVNVGDTVTWRQMDSVGHTSTSDTGAWGSPLLSSGQAFSHTFETAGTFPYHCIPHPGMTGSVAVQGNTTRPPTVGITSPANNSTLTGPVEVQIQANASVVGSTITGVEFFDGANSLGSDDSSPYSVTVTLGVGTHVFTARATAANGETATSSSVTVTVSGPSANPVVTITEPANNTVIIGTNFTLTATASVEGGTITMVEFFDDESAFLGMVHGAPFTISASLPVGTHPLTAKATANTGTTGTSAPVTITIQLGGTEVDNPYPPLTKTDATIELQLVLDGLVSPLGLAAPDDSSNRFFVFDQIGMIHAVVDGTRVETPVLDVRDRLVPLESAYDERGLLGVATHPNFAQSPFIYTYTSEPVDLTTDFSGTGTNDHQSVITEWRIDAANSNRVDIASRREILRIDKPQSNHNGGVIHFGMDGMLYIAVGDGGSADDEGSGHAVGGNGQDLTTVLGKILRIDVDARTSTNGQYGVPSDNPFVGRDGLDEIYAYGFRNPYSWSFDRLTGEMYVADVGQNDIEELDRVFSGGNYGWPIKEGSYYFDPNGDGAGFITSAPAVPTVPDNLIDPIAEYDHSEGLAIVGGYFYHGTLLPNLIDRYITADFGRFDSPAGRLFVVDRSEFRELRLGKDDRTLGHWVKGFGQDGAGELYVFASTNLGPSGASGKMFKIVPVPDSIMVTSASLAETNLVANWTNGVGPFVVESKISLNDRGWRVLTATTNRSAEAPLQNGAEFIRVVDSAGISGSAFTVYMTGASERPDPVTDSTALGTGTLNLEGNMLHFDIQYSSLLSPAVAAHIHGPATAAEARSVLIDLAPYNGGAFSTSGVLSGSVLLSPENKAHLLAGKTYVNIHTTNHQGGEIRGQVAPVLFMADLNGANERPDPVETPGAGTAIFMLVGNKLTFDLEYSGLKTNAHLAHIHGPAAASAAGPVMVDLAPFNGGAFGSNGTLGGTATLTPDQLAALVDGLTYVNIHTPIHGGGEIRGQIWPRSSSIPLTASLSGAAEKPAPVDTPAVGTATFAMEENTLHFNVRYGGLKAVANNAHIHGPATAALPAGVMINLVPFNGGSFSTKGALSGSVPLTEVQRAAILEGRTYVNIHSSAHGGGEIRGQVIPAVLHAVLLGASERTNSVHTLARGRGTLILAADQLSLNVTYTGLSTPAVAAHIHGPGPTTGTASVMVDLAPRHDGTFGTSGSFSGTVPLTPAQIAALVDGLTYLNIHTGTHSGGEIRGQLVR